MVIKDKNNKSANRRKLILLFIMAALFPAALYAAVQLSAPTTYPMNSKFQMREVNPASGKTNSPHRGQDYKVPCYTQMSAPNGGAVTCTGIRGGYGGTASVTHECGVTESFNHLFDCKNGVMTTGGGTGNATKDGNSTGCHLHYEIRINGVAVDPLEAFNTDLCNADNQKRLIDDAQTKLNGQAGGGGGAASGGTGTQTPPEEQSYEYVPTGGTHPTTGVVNTGQGYYVVTDKDGRETIVVDLGNTNSELPALPPGNPADLTPPAETDNEVTGCATDTWKAMVNQSVLQTRREMIANQVLVTKPDSVMAYSCLTEHMNLVGQKAGPIFSETKRWVNVEVPIINGNKVNVNKELGEYSLDGAIVNAATEPYEGFMAAFFAHDFLGGMQGGGHDESGGEEHDHAEDQSYTACGTMAAIWKLAKCSNVDDNLQFYTFKDLISNDPRKFPKGYECNYTGITQAQIDTAKGKEVKYDKIVSHLEYLYPKDGVCAPPVKTGVTVVRQERGERAAYNCPPGMPFCDESRPDDEDVERISTEKTFPDAVCLTMGCSYQADGKGGGSCVVK